MEKTSVVAQDQVSPEDRAEILALHNAWKVKVIRAGEWAWFWYTMATVGSLAYLFIRPDAGPLWLRIILTVALALAWRIAHINLLGIKTLFLRVKGDKWLEPLPREPVTNVVRRAREQLKPYRFSIYSGLRCLVPLGLGFPYLFRAPLVWLFGLIALYCALPYLFRRDFEKQLNLIEFPTAGDPA